MIGIYKIINPFGKIYIGQSVEINKRWGKYKRLASHYLFEDLFWKRKTQKIDWLENFEAGDAPETATVPLVY